MLSAPVRPACRSCAAGPPGIVPARPIDVIDRRYIYRLTDRPPSGARATDGLRLGTGYRPLLAELANALARRMPTCLPVGPFTQVGERAVLLARLADARLDLVIDRAPTRREAGAFDYRPLFREPVALFVDRRHPLAAEIHVTMTSLAPYPIAVYGDDEIHAAEIERQLCTAGALDRFEPHAVRADAVAASVHGDLIVAAPVGAMAGALRQGGCVALPVQRSLQPLEFGALTRRRAFSAARLDPILATISSELDTSWPRCRELSRDFIS